MYFIHSGLQDEMLHVTIFKLPLGSLTCTRITVPALGAPSEGRRNYLVSSLLPFTCFKNFVLFDCSDPKNIYCRTNQE